jgi:hypothetical protein
LDDLRHLKNQKTMATLNLLGAQKLAPASNTIYDCVANAGTNPDTNNEVYIYCDTGAVGSITLRLPNINFYNGIYNTKINIVDTGFNASANNVTVEAGTFTTIFSVLSNNVATITTAVPHGFNVGDVVTITGVGVPYNGNKTITAVTSTTFSFAQVNAPIPLAPIAAGYVAYNLIPQYFSCTTIAYISQITLINDGGYFSCGIFSPQLWQVQGI